MDVYVETRNLYTCIRNKVVMTSVIIMISTLWRDKWSKENSGEHQGCNRGPRHQILDIYFN